MVRRIEVRLTDDLNGTGIRPGRGETVRFGLDGTSYEIDLTTKNASALRKALQPYVNAGRPVKEWGRRPVRKIDANTRTIK
jgi:hypothetical protein